MAIRSLGLVTTTAGTPVRITANESDPTKPVFVHSIFVQAWHANTNRVWIGTSTMVRATGVGVHAIVGAPATATESPPSWSATNVESPNGFNCATVYLDVDTNDEGAIVSVLEAYPYELNRR